MTTPSTVVRLHPKTRKNDAHNNHIPQQEEPARYGLWNVELRRQLDTALLAAVAEACPNYASSLPAMAELVAWIQERLPRSLVDDNGNHNDRRTHAALDHYIQQAVAPLYEMPSRDDNGHDDGHDDNDKTRKNLELVTGGGGHVVQVARLAMEAMFHLSFLCQWFSGTCFSSPKDLKARYFVQKMKVVDDTNTHIGDCSERPAVVTHHCYYYAFQSPLQPSACK